MSINNADVIKLLRSDRSSDTRALFFILIFFYLTVVRGRRSSEGGLKMEEKTQVSEVGFEPGTFRSCVEHSNHYATETPPIPDVLLVLVAPKYINRNVTTTLQSRFTPTPTPQATHSSFFILLLLLLFYFILFYFFTFFLFFLFFYFFIKYLALFTPTVFPISTPTRTVRRPSPPQPALFAEVRTLPIFQHFSSKSLSFNMADLGLKYSDSTDFSTFFFKIPIF